MAIQQKHTTQHRMKRWQTGGIILQLLLAWTLLATPLLHASAQEATPSPQATTATSAAFTPTEAAEELLTSLTPEERVGQLFLVAFQGDQVGADSPIYDLITRYHIGGVVLRADKDNFTEDETAENAANLVRQIQLARYTSSQEGITDPETGEVFTPTFIPLLIGMAQEGDGYPYDQIINDLTPLPNQMGIGATWNEALATRVGTVLGAELAALGINMLLGPSLDVLETIQLESGNNLGTRTFGGDPYWVGEMGQAYIKGVHQGSQGRIAVVAKHFPGHGGSDRLPEQEVATVRKTLEQLKSFELVPFFAVTGNALTPEETTDGMLTAHIRYQGFQGNIRATTRPVSFDPQALNLLMSLPQVENWRTNGGVMVSDDLGSQAVRRFYELTNQPFDMPRRVALNAFLAGNDLLYVADFSSGDLDAYTSAIRTLEFFAQKYREDAAFAQRVDESAKRVLSLKFKLYQRFSLDNVLLPDEALDLLGQSNTVTFETAQEAATLISPSLIELDETIPDSPNLNDRIVFISDTRTAQQCSDCPKEPMIEKREFEQVVLRRYGPQASGQVTQANIISYSIDELEQMLSNPDNEYSIELSLRRANWIVFNLIDNRAEQPAFDVLKRFLVERPDLFQQTRLILFAFNAPYFLDATNISKLTAYFGLYGKSDQFIELASYLLFKELIPTGASPVSIPGTGYDLNAQLYPDPDQTIPLELDLPSNLAPDGTTTPEPTPVPQFLVGDVIPVRTGVILDHNGNRVPDGTLVEFTFSTGTEANPTRQTEITRDGVARSTFSINTSGTIEIIAVSEQASSSALRFDIPAPGQETTPAEPTAMPTGTAEPTPTETPTPTQIIEETEQDEQPSMFQIFDWGISVLISIGLAAISYRLALISGGTRWGVRSALLVFAGAMIGYSYLVMQLPGSEMLMRRSIQQGVILISLIGAIVGLLIAWSWRLAAEISLRNDIPSNKS